MNEADIVDACALWLRTHGWTATSEKVWLQHDPRTGRIIATVTVPVPDPPPDGRAAFPTTKPP
jgi:hypothetical protein